MNLTRYVDVHPFYAAVEHYLLAHEAHHNLMFGICFRLMEQPEYSEHPPYFAAVRDGEEIVAAAVMTPPHNLVLALSRADAALELIAADVRAFSPPTGVIGAKPESLAFAQAWQRLTGQTFRLAVAERIYELDHVIVPAGVPGRMRIATAADRDLLVEWTYAFALEALHDDDRARAARSVDMRLRSQAISDCIWEDGRPVSFTSAFRGTPNGARIGPVWTPPELRGRGYASACVAQASRMLLDEGRRFCFLFTNLANPTANHIYQAIGYRPVVDVDEYRWG